MPHTATQHYTRLQRWRRTAALCLCCLAALSAAAHAQSNIAEEKDRLSQIKKEIAAKKQLRRVAETKAKIIEKQIQNIDAQAKDLEERIATTEADLHKTTDAIERIRKNLIQQEVALAGQKKVLAQLLRAQYEHGSQPIATRLILPPRTLRMYDYQGQIRDRIHTTVKRINKLRRRMQAEHASLEKKKNEVEDLKKKLDARNAYLESTRSYKAYLAARTKHQIRDYESAIEKLRREEERVRHEIDVIELAKLDNINFADLPSPRKADFRMPVSPEAQAIFTQGYGRTTFAKKSGRYRSYFHNGVDITLPRSTKKKLVVAAASGTVVATGTMGYRTRRGTWAYTGYGNWVAIDHGNGLTTLYGHLKKITTKKGARVKKGAKIGIMGSTGNSTGTHLHFTIFASKSFDVRTISGPTPTGAHLNPRSYLP